MSKPSSFAAVIDLWATPAAAVSDIGCSPSQLFKWRRRDRIPQEWWGAVLSTAIAKSAGCDSDLFVKLAARELAEVRP